MYIIIYFQEMENNIADFEIRNFIFSVICLFISAYNMETWNKSQLTSFK